jgi:hypothetical protein
VAELRAITKRDAALAVEVLLDAIDAPERAQAAWAAAFDDLVVTELAVFTPGHRKMCSALTPARRAQATVRFASTPRRAGLWHCASHLSHNHAKTHLCETEEHVTVHLQGFNRGCFEGGSLCSSRLLLSKRAS